MSSFMRRAMVYLGLTDDDYEDWDAPGEPEAPAGAAVTGPAPGRAAVHSYAPSDATESVSAVRTLARDHEAAAPGAPGIASRPSVVRPIPVDKSPRVHVVSPSGFSDAQEIGDRLKTSQPVIVNLQGVERDLGRRITDICSGFAYALGGSMDKVADRVFLLSPANVEVSAEERERVRSEHGLGGA